MCIAPSKFSRRESLERHKRGLLSRLCRRGNYPFLHPRRGRPPVALAEATEGISTLWCYAHTKRSWQKKIFFLLLLFVVVLSTLNLAKARGWLIPTQPPIAVEGKVVSLDSFTLEQKIAQMIVVAGSGQNKEAWQRMQLGGIHLFAKQREELFTQIIEEFQEGLAVPFFVTADLEGCQNPFAEFYTSPAAADISTVGNAFQKGSDDGKQLARLGFSINFAPVVDLQDEIWKCRSFPGDEKAVAELAEAYTLGLQSQNILATAKHFPGKTLVVSDPHKGIVAAEIAEQDLFPYGQLKDSVKSIMVSHIIVSGSIDSQGEPSVASGVVIARAREEFPGLIISDEINMLGLKNYYGTREEMYIAVFKAGNDLILNFNEDPNEIYHMIQVVKKAVEEGEIAEAQIDASVRRILMAKGLVVE